MSQAFELPVEIKERGLNALHVFIASLLGRMAELGILTRDFLEKSMPLIAERVNTWINVVKGEMHGTGSFEDDVRKAFRDIVDA